MRQVNRTARTLEATARTLEATARTLEEELRQVCGVAWVRGQRKMSDTGRVWAAGFHHVTARSRLARVLKLTNLLFFF